MSRKTVRKATDRMIHVRINEETHQRLKMHAVASKTTIQQIVESLLSKEFSSKRKQK
jgi:predicted HicB family RNase H-like nuclease